jgi:chaperonin GroES
VLRSEASAYKLIETGFVIRAGRSSAAVRQRGRLGRNLNFCAHPLGLRMAEEGMAQTLKQEEQMKVRPLNDRVLVVRVEEEQKTKGGIIIPDTAKEKPMEGKVIAAGPGKLDETGKRTPLDIKAGDRVLFSKYAGTEIKIDGIDHLFMREDDILGVIE